MNHVHRVKDKSLIKSYRLIPYVELVEALKDDGVAFLENNPPLKRQTVYKAAKKLSELVGGKVIAEKAIYNLPNGKSLLGYALTVKIET